MRDWMGTRHLEWSGVLFDQVRDGLAELLGQGVGFAEGQVGGGDRLADDEFDGVALSGAFVEVVGVNGEQVIDANQSHGDERDLGADG